MEQHAQPDQTYLVRYPGLTAREIFKNRTSLRRAMDPANADPFPQPIRLGPNSIAWRLIDVERWLDRRAKATNGTAA